MSQLLDQLCECHGVLPYYHDIWGRQHHTSDAVKRALLAAMGVAVESEEEAAAALLDFERRQWQQPLPSVQVLRETARPWRIALALPAGDEALAWRWRLRREAGAEEGGEFQPSELEEAGRIRLDDCDYVRRVLVLDLSVEQGYHRFFIEGPQGRGLAGEMSLIVAPDACYLPPAIQDGGRAWGLAAQLYALRSARNWGMGDFGDLRELLGLCGEAGASTLLLNPLHALFPDAPEHASPYSPSNRAYLNTLYLEVEAVAEFAECAEAKAMVEAPAFQEQRQRLRAAEQVDYRGVAALKAGVLDRLYRHFRARHLDLGTAQAQAFRAFQSRHGPSLRGQALFEALQEHFRARDDSCWGWPAWPEAYRDPGSPEVAAFRAARLERVEFFEYLQWQAEQQLAAAGARSAEAGLGVGMMFDLAIGVAEGGAATWMRRELYALGASAGAPPDEINRLGQDWGLPPWIPHRLTAAAYEPFIELLRANMRAAGALRLDHVIGLYRLFWVARGLPAAEGAYVRYPFEDLLGILALESQRNRCLVIGEDLGTVPNEVRHALDPMQVLSTRLLYFEREHDGRFKPPPAYPANAAAAVTTHDLPTLSGYWQGRDIELWTQLGLFPDEATRAQRADGRSEDRARLLQALAQEGLLPEGAQPEGFPEMTAELAAAAYAYLARTPSKLLLLQLEDGLGVREQPNLPGTVEPAYPCWRLKLPLALEAWRDSAYWQMIVAGLRRERPPPN